MTRAGSAMIRKCLAAVLICVALAHARPAMAHPHVFVDAQIDVVMDARGGLEPLKVTWSFDPFHTLYILAFDGITPTQDGRLIPADQAALAAAYTDWQRGFDGFAKLFFDGAPVALDPPSDVRARLQNDQLEISFTRRLATPAVLTDVQADIAIYDATYYHAITLAAPPRIHGATQSCVARLHAFDLDQLTASAQAALTDLEQERRPAVDNVGRLLADRITISCA